MDNLDLYTDEELYEDEEEEAIEEEGSNRTFIILVASLGGLLAVTVCIFVVWALVISPRMAADRVAQNQAIEATNEALLEALSLSQPRQRNHPQLRPGQPHRCQRRRRRHLGRKPPMRRQKKRSRQHRQR